MEVGEGRKACETVSTRSLTSRIHFTVSRRAHRNQSSEEAIGDGDGSVPASEKSEKAGEDGDEEDVEGEQQKLLSLDTR